MKWFFFLVPPPVPLAGRTRGIYLHRPLVLRVTLYWRFPNTSGRSVEVTLAPGDTTEIHKINNRVQNIREMNWSESVPNRLEMMVTRPVPAPSSITFLSLKLNLS